MSGLMSRIVPVTCFLRRLAVLAVTGVVLSLTAMGASIATGALTSARAQSLIQVIDDFREALEPYGMWQPSRRWGEVWVPFDKPSSWRPYTVGRWVFTDEWGWYWVSAPEEEEWGWIAFHYGRWVNERGLGWVWVPGEKWAPAWVNWRHGDDYIGWAPLPPEEVIYEYDDDPLYWTFIAPRYLFSPQIRTYYIEGSRRRQLSLFRRTVVVNRTLPLRGRGYAVNPGIAPAFIARSVRRPVPTFHVRPRVLSATAGVDGAISTRPGEFRGRRGARPDARRGPGAAVLTPSPVFIQPGGGAVVAPQPLGRGERGRLGSRPPRAAIGTVPPPDSSPVIRDSTPAVRGPSVPGPSGVERNRSPGLIRPPGSPPPAAVVTPPAARTPSAPPPGMIRSPGAPPPETHPPQMRPLRPSAPPPAALRPAPPPPASRTAPRPQPPAVMRPAPPPTAVIRPAPPPAAMRPASPPPAGLKPAQQRPAQSTKPPEKKVLKPGEKSEEK